MERLPTQRTGKFEEKEDLQEHLDGLRDQIALVDSNGFITMVNQAWRQFGLENGADPKRTSVGCHYFNDSGANPKDPTMLEIDKVLKGQIDRFEFNYACHCPNKKRWFSALAMSLSGGGMIVSHRNITGFVQAKKQATEDALTKLLNRRGIEERLWGTVNRSFRDGNSSCALLIDCDDFKNVNGVHGHAIGDEVLRAMASLYKRELRPSDILGRIGGDEFLIILPSSNIAVARSVGERLRRVVASSPLVHAPKPVTIKISVGIIEIDPKMANLDAVLRTSGEALKESKKRGKDTVTFKATKKFNIAENLFSILQVYCQNIVNLNSDATCQVELLTRGPPGPYHLPGIFFSWAENQGYLAELDWTCLQVCLKNAAILPKSVSTIHINVLPTTILNNSVDAIMSMIPSTVDNDRICLELSEQQLLGDPCRLRDKIRPLKNAGIKFAVDDVGFGRTVLESLIVLEPDVIKIDKRFVKDIEQIPSKVREFKRLLAVAESLAGVVVVEGIETRAEADRLREMGVMYGQGYLWSKPFALS